MYVGFNALQTAAKYEQISTVDHSKGNDKDTSSISSILHGTDAERKIQFDETMPLAVFHVSVGKEFEVYLAAIDTIFHYLRPYTHEVTGKGDVMCIYTTGGSLVPNDLNRMNAHLAELVELFEKRDKVLANIDEFLLKKKVIDTIQNKQQPNKSDSQDKQTRDALLAKQLFEKAGSDITPENMQTALKEIESSKAECMQKLADAHVTLSQAMMAAHVETQAMKALLQDNHVDEQSVQSNTLDAEPVDEAVEFTFADAKMHKPCDLVEFTDSKRWGYFSFCVCSSSSGIHQIG